MIWELSCRVYDMGIVLAVKAETFSANSFLGHLSHASIFLHI